MSARNAPRPAPARIAHPDLPGELEPGAGLRPRESYFQVQWTGMEATTDAAHSTMSECTVEGASVDRLDLTGAVLTDVEVRDLRATELSARSSRWRSVRVQGGRIGTLDLSGSTLESVELRGVRVDYVSLGSARATDLLLVDCMIGTIDLPAAICSRVTFERCRADDVDTRGLRCTDVDLRGLDAVSFSDPAALRGATLTEHQAIGLAGAFAVALGIDVRD